MAYRPSLQDFDEKIDQESGFIPTLSDFDYPPIKEETGIQRLLQVPKNLLVSAAQEGLNLGQDIINLPQILSRGLIKSPLSEDFQIAGLGKNPLAGQARIPAYEDIKESPEAYAASGASLALTGGGRLAGMAGDFLKKGIKPSVELIKSAADLVTGKNVVKAKKQLAGRAAENIEKLKKTLEGKLEVPEGLGYKISQEAKNLQETSDKVLSDYYGTDDYINLIGKEQKLIGSDLRSNYNKITGDLKKRYGDVLRKDGDKYLFHPGIKLKSLKIGNDIKGFDVLNKSYRKFLEEPNVKNAHDLQSRIGAKIADMNEKNPADRDRDAITRLTDSRFWLQKKIGEIAGKEYKDITKEWRENVIPYHEDSIINKAVRKNIASDSIAKRLARSEISDEERAPIKSIVSHMSSDQKRRILSSLVKNAVSTEGEINVDVLHNALRSAKSKGFGEFITDRDLGYIKKLNESNKSIEDLMKQQKQFSVAKKEHKLMSSEKVSKRKARLQRTIDDILAKEKEKSMYAKAGVGSLGTILGYDLLKKLYGQVG